MTYKSQCLFPGHSRNKERHEIGEIPRVELFSPTGQREGEELARAGEEVQVCLTHIAAVRETSNYVLFFEQFLWMFFHIKAAVFLSTHKQNKETKCMQTLLLNTLFIGFLPRNHASMTIMPSYCYAFSTLYLRPLINAFFLT